jgi:hypothetical protein
MHTRFALNNLISLIILLVVEILFYCEDGG